MNRLLDGAAAQAPVAAAPIGRDHASLSRLAAALGTWPEAHVACHPIDAPPPGIFDPTRSPNGADIDGSARPVHMPMPPSARCCRQDKHGGYEDRCTPPRP